MRAAEREERRGPDPGRAVYTPRLSERAGTTSKFYHGDALGSTRGITNSSQTVTDAVLYDVFGGTGSTATPFGFVGAQGYQSDADSGLQLLGHRMYDPSIGRFISSDPAKDGTNWCAYVLPIVPLFKSMRAA